MEVTIELVGDSDPFEGAYALLNLGEKQKLIRLRKKAQSLSIPDAKTAKGKLAGTLEILQKFSSCFVGLDLASANEHDVTIPCSAAASGQISLRFRSAAGKDSRQPQNRSASKALDAESYMSAHGLHELLSAAVQAVLTERPANPRDFLATFIGGAKVLAKSDGDSTGATTSPETPVVSGSVDSSPTFVGTSKLEEVTEGESQATAAKAGQVATQASYSDL
eukprot:4568632-Amphidinium_carterae.1